MTPRAESLGKNFPLRDVGGLRQELRALAWQKLRGLCASARRQRISRHWEH
jgi:hypothetical protein